MSDPATQEWQQALGESTSARLRQTQEALAASQQDLTRVEKERDAMARTIDRLHAEIASLKAVGEHCSWRGLAEELLSERAGLEQTAAKDMRIYVARGPSGTCLLCGGDIVRGQAVEAVAGCTEPTFAHSACPDKED